MNTLNRRKFFSLSGIASLVGLATLAHEAVAQPTAVLCLAKQTDVTTESHDSPFFEHYHQLSIPMVSLLKIPESGIVVKTSPVDQGSYDVEQFKAFIASASLDAKAMVAHSHNVAITKDELTRIASGDEVEIRVISPNGNYVHNFLVSATPSALAKVSRYNDGKLKI